jgi:hypothetical protein
MVFYHSGLFRMLLLPLAYREYAKTFQKLLIIQRGLTLSLVEIGNRTWA